MPQFGLPLPWDKSRFDICIKFRPAEIAQRGLKLYRTPLPSGTGWHAFRRGLATNLHQLGVSDETIQRILPHANAGVTQSCYIKTADFEVAEAMQQFERSLEYEPIYAPLGCRKTAIDVIDSKENVRQATMDAGFKTSGGARSLALTFLCPNSLLTGKITGNSQDFGLQNRTPVL
jgi:hypothetical protein